MDSYGLTKSISWSKRQSTSIELTAEQAAQAFVQLNKNGKLSDEELDNVAGGGRFGCAERSRNPESRLYR